MATEIGERLTATVALAGDAWSREARATRAAAARIGLRLREDELLWLDVRDLQTLQRHLLGHDESGQKRRWAQSVLSRLAPAA